MGDGSSRLRWKIYQNCEYKTWGCDSDECLNCKKRVEEDKAKFMRSSKFEYYMNRIRLMLLEEKK